MKRNFKLISLTIVAFLFSGNTLASGANENSFNFYFAAGPNFILPTSVRLGLGRWEIGMLGRNFVGANKTFLSPNSAVYSGFALGVNTDVSSNLGFQASVGVNYDMFWGIGLRAEILANANLNATATSYALVGFSYGF